MLFNLVYSSVLTHNYGHNKTLSDAEKETFMANIYSDNVDLSVSDSLSLRYKLNNTYDLSTFIVYLVDYVQDPTEKIKIYTTASGVTNEYQTTYSGGLLVASDIGYTDEVFLSFSGIECTVGYISILSDELLPSLNNYNIEDTIYLEDSGSVYAIPILNTQSLDEKLLKLTSRCTLDFAEGSLNGCYFATSSGGPFYDLVNSGYSAGNWIQGTASNFLIRDNRLILDIPEGESTAEYVSPFVDIEEASNFTYIYLDIAKQKDVDIEPLKGGKTVAQIYDGKIFSNRPSF